MGDEKGDDVVLNLGVWGGPCWYVVIGRLQIWSLRVVLVVLSSMIGSCKNNA